MAEPPMPRNKRNSLQRRIATRARRAAKAARREERLRQAAADEYAAFAGYLDATPPRPQSDELIGQAASELRLAR